MRVTTIETPPETERIIVVHESGDPQETLDYAGTLGQPALVVLRHPMHYGLHRPLIPPKGVHIRTEPGVSFARVDPDGDFTAEELPRLR